MRGVEEGRWRGKGERRGGRGDEERRRRGGGGKEEGEGEGGVGDDHTSRIVFLIETHQNEEGDAEVGGRGVECGYAEQSSSKRHTKGESQQQ